MKTSDKKNKILFLCDLERFSENNFKNTLNLAKTLDAKVELFCVRKATKIAKVENQLSVIRTMNHDFSSTTKSIENILSVYPQEIQDNTTYSIAYGNIKNEVEKQINSTKPDVVVLGKRKRKLLNFIGDSLTEFVINRHQGEIIIATPEREINPEEHISFGIYNTDETRFEKTMVKELFAKSKQPLKFFKSSSDSSGKIQNTSEVNPQIPKVEFVFEQNEALVNNLSKYISLNNINLLCLEPNSVIGTSKNKMGNLVDKLNVSLWISNRPDYSIN